MTEFFKKKMAKKDLLQGPNITINFSVCMHWAMSIEVAIFVYFYNLPRPHQFGRLSVVSRFVELNKYITLDYYLLINIFEMVQTVLTRATTNGYLKMSSLCGSLIF